MRILFNEMKRFYRPVILLLIAVLAVSWYLIFESSCNFYLRVNSGKPYEVAREYHERFGASIDSNEIEEIRQNYADSKLKLNQLVEQTMGKYGIHTIDEYYDYSEKYENTFNDKTEEHTKALAEWGQEEYDKRAAVYEAVEDIYWHEPVLSATMETQAIGDYVDEFDFLKEEKAAFNANRNDGDWFFSNGTEVEKVKLEERLGREEIAVGIGMVDIVFNFIHYANNWSVLIFICCVLLILPLLVKNKTRNITSLQYSSKQGRKIVKKQLYAAGVAAFLMSVVLILTFQIFYFKDGAFCFADCSLNLVTNEIMYWFDFTFFGYMLCYWVKTLLLVIGEILVIFWISYYSNNYITAIASSVPVIALFCFVCSRSNDLLRMFRGYPQFSFPMVFSVFIAIIVAVSAGLMYKAKKADYLLN